MIEIILLIFLTGRIRRIAGDKGLSKVRWTFRTIFSWIAGEFIFLFLGMSVLGIREVDQQNIWILAILGIAGGLVGYFLTQHALNQSDETPPPPEPPEEKDLSYFR